MELAEFLKPKNSILSKSEKKVYQIILEHPAHVQLMTIQKIATDAQTSVASVQRYCQKLGYDGFKEFKFQLKNFLFQKSDPNSNKSEYLKKYVKVVNNFQNIDQKKLDKLTNALINSRNNFILGIYYSSIPAKQLAMCMQDLNKSTFYTDNYIAASHWTGLINKSDTFIVFSISGDEADLKKYIAEPISKLSEAYLITFNPNTKLRAFFKNCIILPGKSFVYSTSADLQSLFCIFVEMIVEHIVQGKDSKEN